MIDDLLGAFHARDWYAFAAVCILIVVYAWRRVEPKLGRRIPDGWRWLPPVLLGAATGFVEGYDSGAPPAKAFLMAVASALSAALGAGVLAMGLAAWLKESPVKVDGGPGGSGKSSGGNKREPDSSPKAGDRIIVPISGKLPKWLTTIVALVLLTGCGLFGGPRSPDTEDSAAAVLAALDSCVAYASESDDALAAEHAAELAAARQALRVARSYLDDGLPDDALDVAADVLPAVLDALAALDDAGVETPPGIKRALVLVQAFLAARVR